MDVKAVVGACLALGLSVVTAFSQEFPAKYPAAYKDVVDASRAEKEILVYNDMSSAYWDAIIPAFNAHYPWIKVQQVDLGDELFERYYAEEATNARTADLILASEPDYWRQFFDKGHAAPYQSPEAPFYPDWSKPVTGVYTPAVSPLIVIYNKKIIPEDKAPKSLKEIAAYGKANPATGTPVATYGLAWSAVPRFYFEWLKRNPGDEETLKVLGTMIRPESSASSIIEKVVTGEVKVGYFVSTTTAFNRLQKPTYSQVLGWSLVRDGTPMVVKGLALPKGSRNAASAKLLLDFLLSHEGQIILAQKGLTPVRNDVKSSEVPYFTYDTLVAEIGAEKAMVIGYDNEAFMAARDTFLPKLKELTKLQ